MRCLTFCAALSIAGCYESHLGFGRDGGDVPPFDAGTSEPDGGLRRDAGRFDAGRFDGGFDAGFDGGRFDAGRFDAGRFDAGRFDAGLDAGRDAGRFDAGDPPDGGGPVRPALRTAVRTYFSFPDEPVYDLPDGATFELWVRPRPTLRNVDFCGKGDEMSRDLIVGLRGSHLVVGWSYAGESHLAMAPTPMDFDRWTHVAMVRRPEADGRHTLQLFVDGMLVRTESSVPNVDVVFNDLPFLCGRADVDIDEMRLWRVARSESDLRANMGMRISGGAGGMVAYWRLDERGQILVDYTANGHAGILGARVRADDEDAVWITDGVF